MKTPTTDESATAYAEQVRRLRSFLAPQVLHHILTSSEEELLAFRQRDITVVFCDLRGFTAFVHRAPSAVITEVLGAYHRSIGPVIVEFDGTLERFTGDGVMVYFDGAPVAERTERAVRMAVRIRDAVGALAVGWHRCGHQLGIGIGVALGEAILGPIGFGQRYDYAAIGPVTNLAARLCAEAGSGQVLVTERCHSAVRAIVEAEPLGPRRLKGLQLPLKVYSVLAVRDGQRRGVVRDRALEYVHANR